MYVRPEGSTPESGVGVGVGVQVELATNHQKSFSKHLKLKNSLQLASMHSKRGNRKWKWMWMWKQTKSGWQTRRERGADEAVTFYGSDSGTGTGTRGTQVHRKSNQRVTSRVGALQSQSKSESQSELRAYLALLNNFHDHETQLKLEPRLSNRPRAEQSSISGPD